MNFFEYLFCRLTWFKLKVTKVKDDTFRVVMVLSVLQTLSVMPLVFLLISLIDDLYYSELILALNPFFIICIIIAIINYRSFKKKQKRLLRQFNKIPTQEKKIKDVFCIVYIIASLIILPLLILYFKI